MNQISTRLIIFALLLSTFSCRKEIEEIPPSNTPVFRVGGSIGADNIDLVVGEDATMTTAIEQINGVNFYSGTLHWQDKSLEIGIYNGNNDLLTHSPEELINQNGLKFSYLDGSSLLQLSKNTFNYVENLQTIKWSVDGVYKGDNDLSITAPGVYDVCGEFIISGGGSYIVCNEMIIGYNKSRTFNLDYMLLPNENLVVGVKGNTEDISAVKWYVNNELISNELSLNTFPRAGANFITAEITFNNGVTRRRSIMVQNDQPSASIRDFGYLENSSKSVNDFKVRIKASSPQGTLYSDIIDNESGTFTINNIRYVETDAQGKRIYMIDATVKANIKSLSFPFPTPVELNINWAIPYY